jgi:hypothetical protein
VLAAEAIQTGSERQDSRYDPNGANISRVGKPPRDAYDEKHPLGRVGGAERSQAHLENRLGLIRRNDGVVLEWGRDYDVPMNNTSIAGV